MTEHSFEDFTAVIQSLSKVTDKITLIEREKAAAAADRKHELLDNCIQEEQAVLLQLRGLEQKRSYYEGILSRELTDLNDQFTSLRYLSEELQIRARGLRSQKNAA